MEVTWLIIFALLGAVIGSFLNVCIDRLPAGKSLAYPPSSCDSCQHRLSPLDLIPVISYLLLRGRCRYCRQSIPMRVFWVELLTSILFAVAFWRYGLSARFAVTALYSSVFLVIMFIDMEHKLILNKVVYPTAVPALILLAVDSLFPQASLFGDSILIPQPAILSGVIGGAAGFVFFLLVYLIYPSGMGEGDVKLAGLIGLTTGFPLAFVALFIGIVSGGLAATALLLSKKAGRKAMLPYGSFLSLGPILTLLWGNAILIWYLGFF